MCEHADQHEVIRLLHQITLAHGAPRELVTDNGSTFVADDVVSMLKALHIERRSTTPYHPRTNGRCERFNGVIKQIISTSPYYQTNLPAEMVVANALLVYRTRPLLHGFSLYFLVYGCNPPSQPIVEQSVNTQTEYVR